MEHLGLWPTTEDEGRREWVPLRQLGWAFLLAWVFCVFYTNAAGALSGDAVPGIGGVAAPDADGTATGASSGASSIAVALFYAVLPLAASVATLAAIVLAEPRIGAPTSHRSLIIAAPLLTAASTPLMFVSVADPALNALLFGLGAVATGVGSALLWVMWGEYYATMPRDRSELLAPVSAVSAALVVLLVSAMDGWVPIAVASALPLLSGLCFYLVWTPEAARTEEGLVHVARTEIGDGHPLAGLGRTGLGILVVFAIVSIAGMMSPGPVDELPLQATLVFSAIMMAVVATMAVSGPRRMSLFFLYRWICPTLVIGFAAVILFGQAGAIVAVAASLGGRFTFCLIAQVYFANYAAAGRATPAQASSLGWLFVHAGDLLGGVLWILVAPVAATPAGITAASTACIVVLVTVTMAVMGETSTFLRIPEHKMSTSAKEGIGPGSSGATVAGAKARTSGAPEGTPAEIVSSRIDSSKEAPASQEAAPESNAPQLDAPQPATPTVVDTPGEERGGARIDAIAREAGLTPREAEVFALLAQGRSIPYIRDELIISRETAATHAKHIYAKLGVHSRQELIDLVHS